ncbi:MAG: hypothetical protein O2999_10465 [Nitrospirae bacterium]|nr:hypothetical protein [Nitrospirota bacterium]
MHYHFSRPFQHLMSGLFLAVLAWSSMGIADVQAKGGDPTRIAKQVTVVSTQDPIPGHTQHQLSLLLPPEDGVVYSGTLTYSSSKPVEVVVLHAYDPTVKPGSEHGEVAIGYINKKPYALSVMQFSNNVEVTNSATVSFAGSGIALHTLSGEKFTATATLDALRLPLAN